MPADPSFSEVLGELLATRLPPPAWWVAVPTGISALLLAITTTVARNANIISTIIHEAGHAAGAILTRGKVEYIEVSDHESGKTQIWSHHPFSAVVSYFSGYAAPPLLGLGFAALLDSGRAPLVLGLTTAIMAAVLLATRDAFTFGVVGGIGALSAALLWWGPGWLHTWTTATLTWLLLFAEAPHLFTVTVQRYWHGRRGFTDGENLAEVTAIPVLLWIAAWFALFGWCWLSAFPLLLS